MKDMTTNSMNKELQDIEFMMSINIDTRELILKFYERINNTEDKQRWIESFRDIQESLSHNSNLVQLQNLEDTPHKQCFKMFQNAIMTEDNAEELREQFLRFKKDFELISNQE